MKPRTHRTARRGFSLVEVLMAAVLIAIGMTGLLSAMATGTRTNEAGQELATASFLAQEIREWTLRLPFNDPDPSDAAGEPGPNAVNSPQSIVDDLNDLMDCTYKPPCDAQFSRINSLSNWSQVIKMTWRDPNDLTTVVADGSTNVVHVSVKIKHHDDVILSTGWIVTGP